MDLNVYAVFFLRLCFVCCSNFDMKMKKRMYEWNQGERKDAVIQESKRGLCLFWAGFFD